MNTDKSNQEKIYQVLLETFLDQFLIGCSLYTYDFQEFIQNHNEWQVVNAAVELNFDNGKSLTFGISQEWETTDFWNCKLKETKAHKKATPFNQNQNVYWKSILNKKLTKIQVNWYSISNFKEEPYYFPLQLLLSFGNYQTILISGFEILSGSERSINGLVSPENEILISFQDSITTKHWMAAS
jgi:hypothetical protein